MTADDAMDSDGLEADRIPEEFLAQILALAEDNAKDAKFGDVYRAVPAVLWTLGSIQEHLDAANPIEPS